MMASPGPIAFYLGPFPVRWYGILVATAIGIGFWLADRLARAAQLPPDRLLAASQWAVLAGLVGARLYEVVFNWDYYGQHLEKIPAIWEGGLAIHGGLIVGPLVGIAVAAHGRLNILRSLDVAAPCIALGQAIGRWGNFFNEEAFGQPTALPWKLYVSVDRRPPGYEAFEYFHPAFLYESLWDFALFLTLMLWLRPRPHRDGTLFFSYLGLYSIGRALIEPLRLDSFWLGGMRVAQLASAVGIVVAAVGLVWVRTRRAPRY